MARKARAGRGGARAHRRHPSSKKTAARRPAKSAAGARASARRSTRPKARKKAQPAHKPKPRAARAKASAPARRSPKRPASARPGQSSSAKKVRTPDPSAPRAAPATHPARRAKGRPRVPPGLLRERRTLQEDESRYLGAALTGKEELVEKLLEHTETGPVLTGGDLDGNWELAYSSGDEAPGGDNPTPDQTDVDLFGRALGIHYADDEELKLGEKEIERDRHRWELDPASAEDYRVREEE